MERKWLKMMDNNNNDGEIIWVFFRKVIMIFKILKWIQYFTVLFTAEESILMKLFLDSNICWLCLDAGNLTMLNNGTN